MKDAVAIAEGGGAGEVRYLGEVASTEAATRKLVAKLSEKYERPTFCYEAGADGVWPLPAHDCVLVAPSLIPTRPGDRVKMEAIHCPAGDCKAIYREGKHMDREATDELARGEAHD
jgi:hypothetical protein